MPQLASPEPVAIPTQRKAANQSDVSNLAVGRDIFFQPKLTVGSPNDPLEHEADAVADRVVRMPEQNFVQRKCASCEEEGNIQRKPINSFIQRAGIQGGFVASDAVSNKINLSKGSGSSMDSHTQSFMQSRFGTDFSDVKIHTGDEAIQMNRDLNAKAFTVGNDIYFNEGRYSPNSESGKHLLAHELTHTVQQGGIGPIYSSGYPFLHVQRQELDAPVARPTLTDLRTIAQGYIGDYFSAATSGLANFERDVQSNFDWTAFWVAVAGNVIWATASFATGGSAFVISLAGIALSTHAAASSVTSAPEFHRETTNGINDIITYLNNQVDRVTRDVDTDATANNLDDNQTRLHLLGRLLDPTKPEFIMIASGGLPNLSQPVVAASVEEQLLLRASQLHGTAGITHNSYGPARFEETWRVEAFDYFQEPMSGYTYPVLKSQSDWLYNLRGASIVNAPPTISNINQAINSIYHTYSRPIGPSNFPMEKRLILEGDLPFGVTYRFDQNNNITGIDSPHFEGWLNGHSYNGRQYLISLLQMIQMHSHATIPNTPQLF